MKPEQLFKQSRLPGEVDLRDLHLGPSYLSLLSRYVLEDHVYPIEIVENIKRDVDFLHDYKSYHLGFFMESNSFFSFSGFSSLSHVLFNSKDLNEDYKVALVGYSYIPEMSLFIDIDESSNQYESIFIQSVNSIEDIQSRIYVSNNIEELIEKLTLYLVGQNDNIIII